MSSNTVIYQGLGMPAIIPFHVNPGMRHVLEFEFVDEVDDPVDQTGTEWTARLHDAATGDEVAVYGTVVAVNVITFALAETVTVTLDPNAGYELRVVRDSPGPDLIFAGAVLFTAAAVPVVTP